MAERTLVIAEAGVNHNGSLDIALKLVDVAAQAGADIVKFQTFRADLVATAVAAKAEYQAQRVGATGSQVEMLRQLELSPSDHLVLLERCRQAGIRFMSTAFDAPSLALLAKLDMPALKIPSGDITNGPLLLQASRLRRPMIVSTGMSTLAEVAQALGVIAFGLTRGDEPTGTAAFDAAFASDEGRSALSRHVTLLHCVTQYPAPAQAVNLRAMDTMATAFGLPVGYSDHTLGIEVALAAVARGACVIEKHFTLDRSMAGPDHLASLEPAELRALVNGIRLVEASLGDAEKKPVDAELPNRRAARRSLVAARRIRRGEVFELDMLAAKRPGDGLSPLRAWDMIGQVASRDYEPDEPIRP